MRESEKCPKCGSRNLEKTWGYQEDPGDPSTIDLAEKIAEWTVESYTIRCLDCGWSYEVENQPGYRD